MLYHLSRIFVAVALLVTLLGAGTADASALPLDSGSSSIVLDVHKDCDADHDPTLFRARVAAVSNADLRNIFPAAADTRRLTDPGLPPPPPPPESA